VLDILGRGPVSVVPNGVDRDAWTLPGRARDPKRVVIASVMRMVGRKRPQALLAMLAALRAHVPDDVRLEAAVIGDGPQRAGLAADVRRLGLNGWVTLPGAMSRADIRERYRDVDLYVAPATLESFGIAALEARCAGLPVIAYRRTGIADFIDTEVNGLLVDDDRSMIEAMRRLSTDAQLRTEIARRNHMSAPVASWERVLADCEQLYQRAHALSRADRPRASTGR